MDRQLPRPAIAFGRRAPAGRVYYNTNNTNNSLGDAPPAFVVGFFYKNHQKAEKTWFLRVNPDRKRVIPWGAT